MNEGFDETWRGSVRYRQVSRELEALLRDVHAAFGDQAELVRVLERLLVFLSSPSGRTDANCETVHYFLNASEEKWQGVSAGLREILDDMSGAMHDSVHRPDIATPLGATPEQLLTRLRALR